MKEITSSLNESTLILHNGVILTMDDDKPEVTAIAITNDIITKLGSDAEVLATKGPGTKVIDLGGNKTVLPGFVEPHTHPDLNSLARMSDPIIKKKLNDVLKIREPILNISPIDYYTYHHDGTYSGQLNFSTDLKPQIDKKIEELIKGKKTDYERSLFMFG